ncbi:MAG: M1 family peptidase, partial [Deltaproteobacteria bacterium]|nr:M1 family peptidase [Deltaproteobacteria bacterium]MBW2534314.1 M1 family peptidase [Deltaproteobacteria bacterium]
MREDPHSYTDLDQGRTTDFGLEWEVDFEARALRGTATLTFAEAGDGPLDLDTRDLRVAEVLDDRGEQ